MAGVFLRVVTGNGTEFDVPKRIRSYEVVEVIGKGAFGVVVRTVCSVSGEVAAAKIMKRPDVNTVRMQSLERELRLSVKVKFTFLLECLDVVYLDDVIIMLMEYVKGTSLIKLVADNGLLVHRYWKKIFTELCLAVQFLHKRGLAHRDIKLENIMVDEEFNVKLCDYGTMCEINAPNISMTMGGTMSYMAPEIVRRNGYHPIEGDVWALGITLYAMMTGIFPWRNNDNGTGLCNEIMNGVTDVERLVPDVKEIVSRCCDVNAETRATVDEILEMPVVKSHRATHIEQRISVGKTQAAHLQLDSRRIQTHAIFKMCVPGQIDLTRRKRLIRSLPPRELHSCE